MISDEKLGPDKVGLTSARSHKKCHIVRKQPDDGLSTCQRIREMLGGRDARSNVGTCLVVFAVPLLVPGVTLTAVALNEETGFAKYGALHVLGMIMLCLACIFIIVGILLNFTCKNEVSPEDAVRSISTHEKPARNIEKNVDSQDLSGELSKPGGSTSGMPSASSTKPEVNVTGGTGNDAHLENHVHFQNKEVGALPPLMPKSNFKQVSLVGVNNGYVSSSDDDDSSDDTDNRSSGSYILPHDSDINVSSGIFYSDEKKCMKADDNHLTVPREYFSRHNYGCDCHIDNLTSVPPLDLSNSKQSNDSTHSAEPNNFFQNRDDVKRPNNLSIGSGAALRTEHNSIKSKHKDKGRVHKNRTSSHSSVGSLKESSQSTYPSQQNSPRARLGGFSNTSALASSLHMSNSDELLPKHLGVENFGSNASVFSHEEEAKESLPSSASQQQGRPPNFTKTFSFDIPIPHQVRVVSHEIGRATTEDFDKGPYTSENYLKNSQPQRQVMEDINQNRFDFPSTEDCGPNVISCSNKQTFSETHRADSSPTPLKPKKRQAFSFPQSRSSSLPLITHSVRQSAPPSLLVSIQGSECI